MIFILNTLVPFAFNPNSRERERDRTTIEVFRDRYGWYYLVDCVTAGDPFKEAELMEWGAIRFLNRLLYIKERNEANE